MVKWYYVQDIEMNIGEAYSMKLNKKYPNRSYGVGIARSNNPGMVGIYYKEKKARNKEKRIIKGFLLSWPGKILMLDA